MRRHYPRANGQLWDSVVDGAAAAGPGPPCPGRDCRTRQPVPAAAAARLTDARQI